MLNRRAFSDVIAETPRHSRLKEDSRQIEFVRVGQALKLEAIVRGDAPTSLASTGTGGVFRRSPWEANCFYPVFPVMTVACADSWAENRLVVGTEEGVYVVEGEAGVVWAKGHHNRTLLGVRQTVFRRAPWRDAKGSTAKWHWF